MLWTLLLSGLGTLATLYFSSSAKDLYEKGLVHGGAAVGLVWLGTWLVEKLKITFLDLAVVVVGALALYGQGVIKSPLVEPPQVSKPHKPFLPWKRATTEAFVDSKDGVGPSGSEVTTDLPKAYRKANISSRGAGCCVFQSGSHAGHWQNVEAVYEWPQWMVQKGIVGGGYPQKVDKLIEQVAKDRGLDIPKYVQHTQGDPKFLELALANEYMPCVTYAGMDPRYGKNTGIDHMVNLVYLDANYACILDNNYIDAYLWMSRDEFLTRWKARGGGWAYVFIASPPPPVPHN